VYSSQRNRYHRQGHDQGLKLQGQGQDQGLDLWGQGQDQGLHFCP